MKRIAKTYLVVLTMAALPAGMLAQSPRPLMRGVSVQQPVAANAVAVPGADMQDALVVAVTSDGTVYLGGDPIALPALAASVSRVLSSRTDKTLYIKADARVPYASLVSVMDAVWKSGVDGVTFLTDASAGGARPVNPKGLELRKK